MSKTQVDLQSSNQRVLIPKVRCPAADTDAEPGQKSSENLEIAQPVSFLCLERQLVSWGIWGFVDCGIGSA